MPKKYANLIIFLIFTAALILIKFKNIQEPYVWDDIGGVIMPSLDMADNGVKFIHPRLNFGHPPLQHVILLIIWTIFGYSITITHIFILLTAAIGVFYTYKLGKSVSTNTAGIGAAILLLFNQLFFAHSAIANDSILLLTLAVITVYYYIKNRQPQTAVFGCLLVLVKEIGILILLSLWLHALFTSDEIKKILTANSWKTKIQIKKKCKAVFGFLSQNWHLAVTVIPLSIWFIYLQYNLGWMVRTDLITNTGGFIVSFFTSAKHILLYDNTITNLNRHNWILTIGIIATLCIKPKNVKKYAIHLSIILFFLLLFALTDDLARYFIIILPFYYIIASHALYSICRRFIGFKIFYYSIITLISIFFISNYYGSRPVPGFIAVSNMEYTDIIKVRRLAADYLSKNYHGKLILTEWPMTDQLTEPRLGYVSIPLKIKDASIYRRDEYALNFGNINKKYLLTLKGSIIVQDKTSGNPILYDLVNFHNIKTVKIFNVNNKIIGIFEIP